MPRSKTRAELERERGQLLERIAVQRHQLAVQFVPVSRWLQWGDRVAATVRAGRDLVQRHPWGFGAVGALLMLRRPRSLGRWAKRGLFVWRAWRSARNGLQALQRQLDRSRDHGAR
jgi:hypothetical protein